MKELTKNAINMLGEVGAAWIDALPSTIKVLAEQWELKNITPIDNKSYHYVAKAIRYDHQPVVLKMGFDAKSIADEKKALSYFDGDAAIRFIEQYEKYSALLLEQAIPGTTLKSFYPSQYEFVMDCYVATVNRLLSKPMHKVYQFGHIKDWLNAMDKIQSHRIPTELLKRAIDVKNSLLSTMTREVVLHGDLHQDNILKNNDTWVVIDPKGIIGEPEFEIAAFDFIHAAEMNGNDEIKKSFHHRVNLIAEKSQLSADRIKDWVFVRLILSAVWHVEDNGDPSLAISLAEKLI